jgi:hypothetical protein
MTMPAFNPGFIPAKARGHVYTVFGFVGLGVGAAQVGYAAADAGQPVWLTVSLSVYAFLGTAIGYTAATNTPAQDGQTVALIEDDEAPAAEVDPTT